jgi:hypothetical protein
MDAMFPGYEEPEPEEVEVDAAEVDKGPALEGYSAMLRQKSHPAPPPKQLEGVAAEEARLADELTRSSSGSAWNASGTWEDRNLSKLAHIRLPELFVQQTAPEDLFVDGFRFTGCKACTGDASVVFSRGKKRPGFECSLELQFAGNFDGTEYTGVVTVTDMTETTDEEDLEEAEVEVDQASAPATVSKLAKSLLDVAPDVTRLFLAELVAM